MGGAPRIGDRAAWLPRGKNGINALTLAAIRGHDNMPARGGMAELTDTEFRGAVLYMFNQSGAAVKEPKAEAPKPQPAEAKPEANPTAAADPRPEPPPQAGSDPWDDDIGNIPRAMDRRGEAQTAAPTQPATQPPIDGAPTPAAAKAGRPARKAATVPPPGQAAAKPKDPFQPLAADTADEYVARVKKQMSSAISGLDYKQMENKIDWNWLAQKDSIAHDGLISFCEEREDYYNRPPRAE